MKMPETKLLVETQIESKKIKQGFRKYLGASAIGNPCARAVWYGFRHYTEKDIDARLNRLFQRGHREEPIIIKDLESIGIKVIATQEGAKFCGGHGGAHHDGILTNVPDAPKTPHLLECKTANDRNFTALKKAGVFKHQQGHYIQVQVYMHLFKLKRALYIAVNKNTDERYYERIKYDKQFAEMQLEKAEDIIYSPLPPKRNGTSDFYLCKWCDYYNICHFREAPREGCRSCNKSFPTNDGKWQCSFKEKTIKFKKQLKGCKFWQNI